MMLTASWHMLTMTKTHTKTYTKTKTTKGENFREDKDKDKDKDKDGIRQSFAHFPMSSKYRFHSVERKLSIYFEANVKTICSMSAHVGALGVLPKLSNCAKGQVKFKI